MLPSGTTKFKAYNPYDVKRIVGNASMKDLAAKAAAKVVSEKVKPKPEKPEEFDVDGSDSNDCVVVDSDEDMFAEKRSTSRSASRRRRSSVEIECLDNSPQNPKISNTKPAKKKRLTKAEKILKAEKEARAAAAQKAREALQASLKNATSGMDTVRPEKAVAPTEIASNTPLKEVVIVLWKFERFKFYLKQSDAFRDVFDQMAVTMAVEPSRVLMFSSKDPAKSVTPLDCLADVGIERLFNTAVARTDEAAGGVAAEKDVPEQYQIAFNVQDGGSKVRTKVICDKRERLHAFMERYCRMMGKQLGDFVFSLDGDRLDPTKMVEFYDLEGNEVIDARSVRK